MKVALQQKGYFATIDRKDWSIIKDYSWFIDRSSSGNLYARARLYAGSNVVTCDLSMHRLIMGAKRG